MTSLQLSSPAGNVPDRAPEVNQTSSREAATQSIVDSPLSTIPFDETPLTIEISDDEDSLNGFTSTILKYRSARLYLSLVL
ncbi:hypothetical protein UA08_09260 [Talaromyces atroroseus]|uniref:Uncharacterized protein n=1 Tax=Talaromyces atroroseus TaxID=1441469 RepID=A0A1Q5Q6H4_TALAT|nr:hypothetical protein UA08_09260 [Talaromyces atroroseus]OKL55445.1 hypothetical protein UA08_09260 [Talaromyces atroroseus]